MKRPWGDEPYAGLAWLGYALLAVGIAVVAALGIFTLLGNDRGEARDAGRAWAQRQEAATVADCERAATTGVPQAYGYDKVPWLDGCLQLARP